MALPRSLGAPASVLAAIALAACGGGSDHEARPPTAGGAPIVHSPRNGSTDVIVGATRQAEQGLLAAIDVRALRAAGFKARVEPGFGNATAALDAVATGTIDAYPDYGDALLSAAGAGEGGDTARRLRSRLAARDAVALPGGALSRGLGVVVAGRTAHRLELRKISDLKGSEVRVAGPRACKRQPDCLQALRRAYGRRFLRFVGVRPDLVHDSLRSGPKAAAIVQTTDPHIGRDGEVLLDDDRGVLPAFPVGVVVRREVAREGGRALRRAIEGAGSALTVPLMQELVARVAFDERPPSLVAGEYLLSARLIRPG
jgi:glycine betaine/choline ABC-type transport system substrate-binding protein